MQEVPDVLRINLARCEEDAQMILNCASLAELQGV